MEINHHIYGYYLEPINSATVDEGRKLSEPVSKRISYRTHAQHDVKIFFTAIHKEVEQRQR